MTYTAIFYLRLFVSYIRYKLYFSDFKTGFNPYNLVQITYGKESKEEFKALKEMDSCSICWKKYREKDKLEKFRCDYGHIFHSECLHKWLKKSLTCPLCRQNLYRKE